MVVQLPKLEPNLSSLFEKQIYNDQALVTFDSIQGENLLLESHARTNFFRLIKCFKTQNTPTSCALATCVIIFNALSITAPITPKYQPYRMFTEENIISSTIAKNIVDIKDVQKQGLTLAQLVQLLQTYPVNVSQYYAGDINLSQFRTLAIKSLQTSGSFLLVNYDRNTISQEGGGHFSPIAAYHHKSDRFLILDVSRYKYSPVWVKADKLYESMLTIDSVSNITRGFAIVTKIFPDKN